MDFSFLRRSIVIIVLSILLGIAGVMWIMRDGASQQLESVGVFAFSQDGNRLVSTISDGIGTWSWPNLQRIQTLPLPNDSGDVAFSGDGIWLARQTVDNIEIWRISDAKRAAVISGYSLHSLDRLYLNQNGTTLVRVSRTEGDTIRVWLLSEGVVKQEIKTSIQSPIVALSPDGVTLAFGSERGIELASLNELTAARFWPSPIKRSLSMYIMAFSPDGQLLATAPATAERVIWVWRVSDGQLLATLRGYQDEITSIAFSTDSSQLAAGGGNTETQIVPDTSVRVWRISDSTLLYTFSTPRTVRQVAFSRDGKFVAANSWDGHTRFWSLP